MASHEKAEEPAESQTVAWCIQCTRIPKFCSMALHCQEIQLSCHRASSTPWLSQTACDFTDQVAHSSTPCLHHPIICSPVDIACRGLPWATVGQSCSFGEPSTPAMGQRRQRYGDLEPKGTLSKKGWMGRAWNVLQAGYDSVPLSGLAERRLTAAWPVALSLSVVHGQGEFRILPLCRPWNRARWAGCLDCRA